MSWKKILSVFVTINLHSYSISFMHIDCVIYIEINVKPMCQPVEMQNLDIDFLFIYQI